MIYYNFVWYICQTVSPFILTKRNGSIFVCFPLESFSKDDCIICQCLCRKAVGRLEQSVFVNWLTSNISDKYLSLLISIVTLLRE